MPTLLSALHREQHEPTLRFRDKPIKLHTLNVLSYGTILTLDLQQNNKKKMLFVVLGNSKIKKKSTME